MIHNMTSYILDKTEDFRINKGNPAYMCISAKVYNELNKELKLNNKEINELFGIPIVWKMTESLLPLDGVYIHLKAN